ncbi:MAG: DUF2203 domain-containing protein [Candidatus Rokuibacteriota bacterium]
MAERYFDRDEVEKLIPALTRAMDTVRASHMEAQSERERQRKEEQRITMSGGGMIDRAAWKAGTARLQTLTAAIQQALQEIADMGGVPKDLELGLVDFLHRRDGREVNLCWKYGEREVRFWHGLDEGYTARKPL